MRRGWLPLAAAFVAGVATGVALRAIAAGGAAEPTIALRNGVLGGWEVTRDDESALCTDPVVFIHARQIECP